MGFYDIDLIVAPNAVGTFRCAIITGTRVDKRATVRNRMRRLVSESVRIALPRVKDGFDAVFVVKRAFATNFKDADTKILTLFSKAKLFRP